MIKYILTYSNCLRPKSKMTHLGHILEQQMVMIKNGIAILVTNIYSGL